ncbi:MAG TPA: glycosyltransferase [Mycobacteriales bacterium]|jgi:glycosyltransferase involved in cell wall biosynthesis|nr:glycosyltransferase [Mycobacteriales bacterium]
MAAVAVLVPAYNHAAYVAEAVRSVDGDVEIVAVDDCSTDGTYDVLRSLVAEVPALRVYRNERNAGGVATVLRALAETTAPYVTVLASDDRWLPGRVDRQLALLEAGAQWSFGRAWVIDAAGARVGTEPQGPPPDADGMLRTLLRGQGVYAPTLMYRRDLLERIGGLSQALWEDLVVTLRFAALGEPAFVPEPLVEYRVHGANVHLDQLARGLHVTAHVEAVASLLAWPDLPAAARPVAEAHAEAWAVLARLQRGEPPRPRSAPRAALDGVVRRQARDLVREIGSAELRRFEVALRLAGCHGGARAIADVRGGPIWRRALRRLVR